MHIYVCIYIYIYIYIYTCYTHIRSSRNLRYKSRGFARKLKSLGGTKRATSASVQLLRLRKDHLPEESHLGRKMYVFVPDVCERKMYDK